MHSIISNYYYFAMVVMVIITIVVATVVIAIDIVFASQFSPPTVRTTWACPTMSACRCGPAPSADHVATLRERTKKWSWKGEKDLKGARKFITLGYI